jgi:hypothetical protein
MIIRPDQEISFGDFYRWCKECLRFFGLNNRSLDDVHKMTLRFTDSTITACYKGHKITRPIKKEPNK